MSKSYRRWKNNKNSRLLNKYYPDMKYKRSFSEYKKCVTMQNSIHKRLKKLCLMTRSLSPHKRNNKYYMSLFVNYNYIKLFYNELHNLCIYYKLKAKDNSQVEKDSCFDSDEHIASDYIERKIKEGNLSNGIILNIKERP